MNELAITIVGLYTSRYLFQYTINKITDIFISKTTTVVTTGAKAVWNKARGVPKPPLEPIEYELIDIEYEDEIRYVTSKPRKKQSTIRESWYGARGQIFDTNENNIWNQRDR